MAITEVTWAAAQRLSTQWPFILTALLVFAGAWALQTFLRPDALSKIPLVSSDIGDESKRRAEFLSNAKAVYEKGYSAFKNGAFRITAARASPVVNVDPRLLPELRNLPDDVLSFSKAIDEVHSPALQTSWTRSKDLTSQQDTHPEYTGMVSDRPIVVHMVQKQLTPALNRLNRFIAEEADDSLREELPSCEDFTAVPINNILLRTIAKVSGRVFVGPELCRTEEYIDMAINFTMESAQAFTAISRLTPSERDARAADLPETKALRDRRVKSKALIKPVVEARKKAMRADADFQKLDDVMQWILDSEQAKSGEIDDDELTEIQLSLTFAAMHTTSMTTLNALYCMAAMPEFIPELRDEVSTVLKEYGTFTTAALQKMRKLDSFLRESTRFYPLRWSTFARKVLKPFTLSNGQLIPAGCIIEVPSYSFAMDPEVYPDPTRFDPWRSYRLREAEKLKGAQRAHVGAANQLVTVSPTALNFGYGRHACPGRFFAANEIKMMLGRIVLNYDVKNVDGSIERYPNLYLAESSVPDPTRKVMFKRVAV